MPMAKMWGEHDPIRPTSSLESDGRAYYYSATDFIVAEELLAQPSTVQDRFYPFVGGINPLDLNAADHIERLLKLYPGFWKGIGELMSRHGELTALTYGEPPRADHPALMRIYALAAKYELPVLIHHNITSWKRNDPIFLEEMENAVKSNPDTTFIWAHAGTSLHLVVPTLADEMRRMLDTYPNLNIDISWVVWEDYIYKDGKVQPEWVALLEDFPDRVLIGSDAVGHWATYGKEITKYRPLLEALTPETAAKVGGGNFLRIMDAVPNER
jgi:predicted TIM-barrel fold metal-dependent hydrolase